MAAQPCVGCMLTSMVNVNNALATAQSILTHIPCSNSLCSWGAAWTPADLPPLPPEPESGSSPAEVAAAAAAAQARQREELTRPDPRSTLHAVVQLLARLSKDHALAEKVGMVPLGCVTVCKAACHLRRVPCMHFPTHPNQRSMFLPCLACNRTGAGSAWPRSPAGPAPHRLQAGVGAVCGGGVPPHSGGPGHAAGVCPICTPRVQPETAWLLHRACLRLGGSAMPCIPGRQCGMILNGQPPMPKSAARWQASQTSNRADSRNNCSSRRRPWRRRFAARWQRRGAAQRCTAGCQVGAPAACCF